MTDLGLSPDTRIATDPLPADSQPLIGNIDERAFFLASSADAPETHWWLAGVDVDAGQPLFPPIRLNAGSKPYCFLNGPDTLLCVSNGPDTRTAWVIDSHTGAVTFSGPTDLQRRPSELWVEQVGMYAVAKSEDEGVYGIGPRAETTWFVPGTGDIWLSNLGDLDVDEPAMAAQPVLGYNAFGETLFSLADGRVIKPEIPEDAETTGFLLYPGGFAAEVRRGKEPGRVMLFDTGGRRTSWRDSGRSYLPPLQNFFDIAYLGLDDGWDYFTPDGKLVLETVEPPVRLVGSRLIVDANEFSTRSWDQYDIHTGAKGERCANLDMAGGYIGYDGRSIAVTSDGNRAIGLDTEATDFDTCERLWTISSPPGSFRYVWRINTTLVQLSDDGTELMSLVAPS